MLKATTMVRFAVIGLVVAVALMAPQSADADVRGTTVWYGAPVYYAPPAYAWGPRHGYVKRWGHGRPSRHVYYYHRPYYPVGPRSDWVQWDSPPAAVIAPVQPYADAVPAERFCREYQREITIGGRSERAYGTACLQPDGSWQIVSEHPEPR